MDYTIKLGTSLCDGVYRKARYVFIVMDYTIKHVRLYVMDYTIKLGTSLCDGLYYKARYVIMWWTIL